MHKNKTLPERPKPPPFDEIIQDIEKCPDDDVVFSSYFPPGGKFYKIWISWMTVKNKQTHTCTDNYLKLNFCKLDSFSNFN